MRCHAMHLGAAAAALLWSSTSSAALSCATLEQFLLDKATRVVCEELDDLRATQTTIPALPQPPVTPLNNSIPDVKGNPLPAFALTSQTDPTVISNGPAPTNAPVPGIQVYGYYADDPAGQARFLLRFPRDWNGKLVVAGASGTRSEFNGDWAWSNYVLPKGYAYASQNKGVLNLRIVETTSPTQPSADPMSCRVNPSGPLANWWAHFYDVDPDKPFTQWTYYMLQTAKLAQNAVKAAYEHPARRTYAVGTSNGGYQVRRAIEEGPDLFDGGVDWEGTYINPNGPNLLIELPVAVKNFPQYAASGFDPNSAAAQAIRAAGYPPDIVKRDPATNAVTDSLWQRYYVSYWEVTACQWQVRFDPAFQTFTGTATNLGDYDYFGRTMQVPTLHLDLAAIATTGKIKKPLVTVAGTMDALLPPENHARAYERAVNGSRNGNNDKRNAQYRLYEVQNGNHLESYALVFPQLRVIQPHAHKAFDLLVDHVEKNAALPPSQCIPLDGSIAANPAQPGQCAALLD
jgi:hypothetical protein